jgi:hypothetical protein
MSVKTAMIIGNGPSSKILYDYGFNNIPDKITTFGSNSLYRICEKANWWPDYYLAYDLIVTPFHKENFKKMMKEQKKIKAIFSYRGMLDGVDRFRTFNPPQIPFQGRYRMINLTTGGMAAFVAMSMGFKKLILIGVDCNYIDNIKESERLTNVKFHIKENPKNNPNYFFDDYQKKGDLYTIPNKLVHLRSWRDIETVAKSNNIEIVNCSDISEVTWFPKSTLVEELTKVQ